VEQQLIACWVREKLNGSLLVVRQYIARFGEIPLCIQKERRTGEKTRSANVGVNTPDQQERVRQEMYERVTGKPHSLHFSVASSTHTMARGLRIPISQIRRRA
jgi:hypothetical protein